MTYSEFCWTVRILCVLHNASETSGIRSPVRNELVGGVERSRHMVANGGMARDLILDEPNAENRFSLVTSAKKLGLFALDEGDHIHVHRSLFGG